MYAYLFVNPDKKDSRPYVIYAPSQVEAEKKYEKQFKAPGTLIDRETW